MSIYKKLNDIQAGLAAPKNQTNTFGGYNYRSCESILEALKPHLKKHELTLTLTDDIISIGDRVYVKATAKLIDADGKSVVEASAFARESLSKKGMDDSQITGAASSYARKYALNGMFCIDDTKDADATNDHGKTEGKGQPSPKPEYETITKESLATLQAMLDALGVSSADYVAELNTNHDLGIEALSWLPATWMDYASKSLQKRINAKKKEAA